MVLGLDQLKEKAASDEVVDETQGQEDGKGKGKGFGKGKGKWGKDGKGKMELMFSMMQAYMYDYMGTNAKASDDHPWKQDLHHAMQRKHGRTCSKEDLVFEISPVLEGGAKLPSYQATVTVEGSETFQGEVAPSKKKAEHMAAKAALEALFPEEADPKAASKRIALQKGSAMAQMFSSMNQPPKAGKKRSLEDSAQNLDPKSRLNNVLQILLKRTVTKTDMIYSTEGGADGNFIGKLELADLQKSFETAEGFPSKKEAESAVAQMALDDMADEIATAEEEYKEKKKAKKAQDLQEKSERQKARKAEEQAAKAIAKEMSGETALA